MLNADRQVRLGDLFKARSFCGQAVSANSYTRKLECAPGVCALSETNVFVCIGKCHLGADNGGSLLIEYCPQHLAGINLCSQSGGQQEETCQQDYISAFHTLSKEVHGTPPYISFKA